MTINYLNHFIYNKIHLIRYYLKNKTKDGLQRSEAIVL